MKNIGLIHLQYILFLAIYERLSITASNIAYCINIAAVYGAFSMHRFVRVERKEAKMKTMLI